MNRQKQYKLTTIFVLSLGMMLNYQNCAPAGQISSVASADQAKHVDVIDSVRANQALSFVDAKVQVHTSAQTFAVDGICDSSQTGAMLRWQVEDVSGQQIARGYVNCEHSSFQVVVEPAQDLDCGKHYSLLAQLGAAEPARLDIERRCAPSVSATDVEEQQTLVSSLDAECFREKAAADSGSCAVVCYENNKVQVEKTVSPESCPL